MSQDVSYWKNQLLVDYDKVMQKVENLRIEEIKNKPKYTRRYLGSFLKSSGTRIKNYRFGKFDTHCRDLREREPSIFKLHKSMKWLISKAYIKKYENSNETIYTLPRYELNWSTITNKLELEEPPSLEPICDKHFVTNF